MFSYVVHLRTIFLKLSVKTCILDDLFLWSDICIGTIHVVLRKPKENIPIANTKDDEFLIQRSFTVSVKAEVHGTRNRI